MARGETKHLAKHQYSTDRDEPCTAKLTLRLAPSQYEKLKQLPDWQEKVRNAIAALNSEAQAN
jgi:hypothetical protein